MFPIVLSYVAHETADEAAAKTQGFVLSTSFVLAMAATFGLIGATMGVVGRIFNLNQSWLSLAAGVIMIAVGITFLLNIQIPLPGLSNLSVNKPHRKGILGALILGVVGAIVMGPCGISYLTPILAVALREGRVLFGAGISFIYGIGHGIPLIVLGTAAGLATVWLRRVQKAKRYIDVISGLALIGVGLYYLWQV